MATRNLQQATDTINEQALVKELKPEVERTIREIIGVDTNKEANAFFAKLRSDLGNYKNNDLRKEAFIQLKEITGDIILKVFSQDIYTNNILWDESLLKSFIDPIPLDWGNVKEYVMEPTTGFDNYDEVKFIPEELTTIPVESDSLQFYQADGKTLNERSKKWVKELTLIDKNLIQYFLSGKTMEFIANKVANMATSLRVGQLHEVLDYLTTTSIKCTINDSTSQNAVDAWINVFNVINDMKFATNNYAFGTSDVAISSNQEDLIILGNVKVFQFLKNMKAFIFHSDLFEPIQKLVDSNFYVVPRKYELGDKNTPIKTKNDYYLDDNTLIILDRKNSVKIVNVLNESVEQFFGKNLATARFKHMWFMYGILKWGKICKITCSKFLTDVANKG